MTSNGLVRFEGRELKPYAEPVSASDLKEGAVYFSVTFVDDEMHIPTMETLVFLGRDLVIPGLAVDLQPMETLVFPGRDLDENDSGSLYFQDIYSYQAGIRYESATGDDYVTFYECSEGDLGAIFEYEQALDVLMRCSLRLR